MLCWVGIVTQIGVLLATAIAGIDASSSVFSNASASASASASAPAYIAIYSSSDSSTTSSSSTPPSTVAQDPTITSCGATINPTDFLAPSLRTLPRSEILPILASELAKIQELDRNFLRIQAGTTNLGPAALSSYLSSLYSTVEADVTSLFGPAGNAFLDFQNLASDPCLYTTCLSQFLAQSANFAVANPSGTFSYRAQPPCCLQCTVYAQGVQLEYWPTPAPQPPISTLINQATNQTFISPSVYAVFTSLRASNLCGPVGGAYELETLTFGPSELSSSSILVNAGLIPVSNPQVRWTAINYADFGPQCICTTDCVFDPIESKYLTNLCTPQLSLPAKVTALDPAWATCASDLGGVFDPPLALPLVSGLTTPKSNPAQTTPSDGSSLPSVTPPVPVNSPTQPVPSQTPPAAIPTPQPVPSSQTVPQNNAIPSPAATESSTLPKSLPLINSGGGSSGLPLRTSEGTVPQPLTINDQTVTANAQSNFVIGSQTLVPGGPAITVSGTPISLASGATEIVVGGSSTILASVTLSEFTTTANTAVTSGEVMGTTTGELIATAKGTASVFTGEAGGNLEILLARAVFIGVALSGLIVWL